MAEAVAETILNRDRLVVEAGTGTGKTFAYLLPAIQSGRKTIISTGTKALKDQLFHRDLPSPKNSERSITRAAHFRVLVCSLRATLAQRFHRSATNKINRPHGGLQQNTTHV